MRNLFFVFVCAFFLNVRTSNAAYLPYCQNFGPGMSFNFQNCINSNFLTVQMGSGEYMRMCGSYNSQADYMYQSCLNDNFFRLARRFPQIYLSYCSNPNIYEVSYLFLNCINSNFMQLETVIP